MFGEMKELAKLASLLKSGPALQARIAEVQARVALRTVSAEAGGGAVVAIADGRSRLVSLTIEPALLDALADADQPADRELAQGLIVEAVNAALERAQRMMAEEAAAALEEMDIPLPKEALRMLSDRFGGA